MVGLKVPGIKIKDEHCVKNHFPDSGRYGIGCNTMISSSETLQHYAMVTEYLPFSDAAGSTPFHWLCETKINRIIIKE